MSGSEVEKRGRINLTPQERQVLHAQVAPMAAEARDLHALRNDYLTVSQDEQALQDLQRQSGGELSDADRRLVGEAMTSWAAEILAARETLNERAQQYGLSTYDDVIQLERERQNDIKSAVNEAHRQYRIRRGLITPQQGHDLRVVQAVPQYPEGRHVDQRAFHSPGRSHIDRDLPPDTLERPSTALVKLASTVAAVASSNNPEVVARAEAIPYVLAPHTTQPQRMSRPDDFRHDPTFALEVAGMAQILHEVAIGVRTVTAEQLNEMSHPDRHLTTIATTVADVVTTAIAGYMNFELEHPNLSVKERNALYRNLVRSLRNIAEAMHVKGNEYLHDALNIISPVLAAYIEPRLSTAFMVEVGLPLGSVVTPQRYAEILRNTAYMQTRPDETNYDEQRPDNKQDEETMTTLLRRDMAERLIELLWERSIGDDLTLPDLQIDVIFAELGRLHPDYELDILDRLFYVCGADHREMLLQLMKQAGASKAQILERKRQMREFDRHNLGHELEPHELRKFLERRDYE